MGEMGRALSKDTERLSRKGTSEESPSTEKTA